MDMCYAKAVAVFEKIKEWALSHEWTITPGLYFKKGDETLTIGQMYERMTKEENGKVDPSFGFLVALIGLFILFIMGLFNILPY